MIERRGLVIAIGASLIVGCAIGLITGVLFARAVLFPHPPGRHFRGGPPMHEPVMHFLERRLDLTGEQSARIEEIIGRARAGSDTLHDRAHAQILEVLTPDQRVRWERMNRRLFRGRGEPARRGRPPMPDAP